jgi:hypothetical protein
MSLEAVWGFDSGELFAFGYNGAMIHYDGTDWSNLEPLTNQDIHAVWGVPPDTLYAVGGNSTILYYEGTHWEPAIHPFQIGTLQSIWGTSNTDIRAGGDYGQMIYYDGETMVVDTLYQASDEQILDLWGSAPDDYYAVTYDGVYHYDGTSWTPIPLDGRQVVAVHGVSATEVYFAGGAGGARDNIATQDSKVASKLADVPRKGFLLRYDGNNYTELASGMSMNVYDVWAVGTNDVFLAGSTGEVFALGHYNGSSVAVGTTAATYSARRLWASGNTAYGVGSHGVVARVNGH